MIWDHLRQRMTPYLSFVVIFGLATAQACGKDAPPAPTTPEAGEAPQKAPQKAPPKGDAETPPAPPEGSETPPPAPKPAPEPDDGVSPRKSQVSPGDVVRETGERTPERAIQDVLRASLEPDEARGWAMFKALLHTDELNPNGLITRRSMNYAASRRKVDLFLVEQGEAPIFKVSRIVDEGDDVLRFFVHNKQSMPTPCTVRIDRNLEPPAWRIGICSL